MNRRAWLWSVATSVAAAPFRRLKLFAQATPLDNAQIATLESMAEVVLPSDLGADGRKKVVAAFVTWIKEYRAGADRGYGYGASTLSAPTGASPAQHYPQQFTALDAVARTSGGSSFASLSVDARQALVAATLNAEPVIARLPARPSGANVVADLMSFYFNSADAWNLAYRARIDRDSCRSLAGSEQPPASLGSR
jgi:hypothetical protein